MVVQEGVRLKDRRITMQEDGPWKMAWVDELAKHWPGGKEDLLAWLKIKGVIVEG